MLQAYIHLARTIVHRDLWQKAVCANFNSHTAQNVTERVVSAMNGCNFKRVLLQSECPSQQSVVRGSILAQKEQGLVIRFNCERLQVQVL